MRCGRRFDVSTPTDGRKDYEVRRTALASFRSDENAPCTSSAPAGRTVKRRDDRRVIPE